MTCTESVQRGCSPWFDRVAQVAPVRVGVLARELGRLDVGQAFDALLRMEVVLHPVLLAAALIHM